jgi:hypothetical protein
MLDERRQFGIKKYGTALMTFNGRDFVKDLMEELVDALQYAAGWKLEREQLLRLLAEMFEVIAEVETDVEECWTEATAIQDGNNGSTHRDLLNTLTECRERFVALRGRLDVPQCGRRL